MKMCVRVSAHLKEHVGGCVFGLAKVIVSPHSACQRIVIFFKALLHWRHGGSYASL